MIYFFLDYFLIIYEEELRVKGTNYVEKKLLSKFHRLTFEEKANRGKELGIVSLGEIQTSNNEVSLKPWGYLSKCHTFVVNNNLVMGWEYSLDVLQRVYWDDWRNNEFLRWKQNFQVARIVAQNEVRLERENEQLRYQINYQQTQLVEKDKKIVEIAQQLRQQQINHDQYKTEIQNLQTQIQQLNTEKTNLQKIFTKKYQELKEAKKDIISRNNLDQEDIEELLEAQIDNNNKWLERIKSRLSKLITNEEINLLCRIQKELIGLQQQDQQLETQIEIPPKNN